VNNLHPTMSKLNEDEYYEVIETIHSLMKDFNSKLQKVIYSSKESLNNKI
jgi:hypothetical protein